MEEEEGAASASRECRSTAGTEGGEARAARAREGSEGRSGEERSGEEGEGGFDVQPGQAVRLVGLVSRADLNGAEGVVQPRSQWTLGRIAVLLHPRGAATNQTIISIRQGNIDVVTTPDTPDADDADKADKADEDDDEGGIVPITIDMIATKAARRMITTNMKRNYYLTPYWEADVYIDLAWAGFVSIAYVYTEGLSAGRALLLPEMQKAYGTSHIAVYLDRCSGAAPRYILKCIVCAHERERRDVDRCVRGVHAERDEPLLRRDTPCTSSACYCGHRRPRMPFFLEVYLADVDVLA
jgi:hypothetical protein